MGANLQATEGGSWITIQAENGASYSVASTQCYPMHESSLKPVDNMVHLGGLNVASILHNLRMRCALPRRRAAASVGVWQQPRDWLRQPPRTLSCVEPCTVPGLTSADDRRSRPRAACRYNDGDNFADTHCHTQMFTYIGPILIYINPYKRLNIFNPEFIKLYKEKTSDYGVRLPPHIYEVAKRAYDDMIAHEKDQGVVISGESGAGKTEGTKICLSYITTVAGSGSAPAHSTAPPPRVCAATPWLVCTRAAAAD